ncbi:MAG: alpha,alpha-trehalase TreF [Bacteroidota bacterium]
MLSPRERWGDLFEQVQLQEVFLDGKTFVDCEPKYSTKQILANYAQQSKTTEFDLKAFVLEHFDLPPAYGGEFQADAKRSMSEHIKALWPVLTRQPDEPTDGSLLPLPYPYIVPGGRFGEIYYWDSYFTMLGLLIDGQEAMVEYMIRNFAHIIDEVGFIPNGNRTYFVTRSQPPFFAAMVNLLADHRKNSGLVVNFLPQLLKEYAFWMSGKDKLSNENIAEEHVVRLSDEHILNRYYDHGDYPREESYREDLETAAETDRADEEVYRDLRAGCESGWDFSCRWLKDPQDLSTIHTTDIIPVDLNALLYNLELTIASAYESKLNEGAAAEFRVLAAQRKAALNAYCWDEAGGFYRDYDFKARAHTPVPSMAAAYPLFFDMATAEQAQQVASVLERDFLLPGGFQSTLLKTGQQWDAPNGWAPLQWIAYQGLKNYGLDMLANTARQRWLSANLAIYERRTKMVEKYDVSGATTQAGGGEYPLQDGFGWSNGVAQAMLNVD